MKKIILIALFITTTSISQAMELPEMSYSYQVDFLKIFPLDKATKADVLNAYGPPRSQMDLTENVSTWMYYKYTADEVSFTIQFRNGKVYDIVNRYKGFLGPTERKARELQGLDK